MNAWDRVEKARLVGRPTATDYIVRIFDEFIELHGDRYYGDDRAIVGGIGKLGKQSVTIIAQEKGKDTKDKIKRNFAMPQPEGYRKALRLMKQAEKFNRPIVCIVDTPGAYPGIGAEERGQGEAIGRNLLEMSSLKVPIITIIIGEGGSGGALALAVSDRVWMLENAIYSILSPEGFASILYKDATRAKEVSDIMKLTAKDLIELKVIDKIIDEPLGGAHESLKRIVKSLRTELIEEFEALQAIDIPDLLENRYQRYRSL